MICSNEITNDMKALGLINNPAAPRCKRCKLRCQWISKNCGYCFVCVTRERKDNPNPYNLKGRLSAELDENQPTLEVGYVTNRTLKVKEGSHSVWGGAVLEETDFESIL